MILEQDRLRLGWRDYGELLRRRSGLLAASGLACAGCAAAALFLAPRQFEARATVEVLTPDPVLPAPWQPGDTTRPASARFLQTQAELARTTDLVAEAAGVLPPGSGTEPAAIRAKLRVTPLAGTNLLSFVYRGTDPDLAGRVANAVAKQFVHFAEADRRLRLAALEALSVQESPGIAGQRDPVDAAVNDFLDRQSGIPAGDLDRLQRRLALSYPAARLVEQAKVPSPPLRRHALPRILLFFLVGVCLGGAAIALRARLTRSGEILERLETRLGLRLAGFVPREGRYLVHEDQDAAWRAEPFRTIRTRIQSWPGGPSNVITTLARSDGEGAGEVTTNLAAVFADAGHTVLLIDGDLRKPTLHAVFTAAPHPGLADYLKGEMRLEETVLKTHYPNLWFMPGGSHAADPSGLLSGRRMADLMREMRTRFDYIFLASPPIFGVADSAVLSGFAGHTILVSDLRTSSMQTFRRAGRSIERSGGAFSGLILNAPRPRRDGAPRQPGSRVPFPG